MGLGRKIAKLASRGRSSKDKNEAKATAKKKDSKNPEVGSAQTTTHASAHASTWHAAIAEKQWDVLYKEMDEYRWRLGSLKARKSSQLRNSSMTSHLKGLQDDGTNLPAGPEPLTRNEKDQTPLHLLVGPDVHAPPNLIRLALRIECGALSKADKEGRYVIHSAILGNRDLEELRLIADGFPRALLALDKNGKSPLSLAFDKVASKNKKMPDKKIGHAWKETVAGNAWREFQLLSDLVKEKELTVMPKESKKFFAHLLQTGSPSDVFERVLDAGKFKTGNTALWEPAYCSRLINLVFRQKYPLTLLQAILRQGGYDEVDPQKEITKALRQGLIKHYKAGSECCVVAAGNKTYVRQEVIRYYIGKRTKSKLKQSDDLDPTCRAWWTILRFLLAHTWHGGPSNLKKEDLLHVALSIPACPPSIIELVVAVYPQSRMKLHPTSDSLPLHTACRIWKGNIGMEEGYSMDAVLTKMIMGSCNGHYVWRRFQKRLPLHLAIAAGKDWSFIQGIVRADCRMLLCRDPCTRLFPFQQAAVDESTGTSDHGAGPKQLVSEAGGQGLERLSLIFELLRADPDAVGHGALTSKYGSSGTVTQEEQESISSVFLSRFYNWDHTKKRWGPKCENLKHLRESIQKGLLNRNLTGWWNRTKRLAWSSYSGEYGFLPRQDEFILHCLVANRDTPPIVTELAVQLFPVSTTFHYGIQTLYPVHVAATVPNYVSEDFELPDSRSAFEILLQETPSRILLDRNFGRSTLEIAIESGRTFSDVKTLIDMHPEALIKPDQYETGLLPFQLISLPRLTEQQHLNVMRGARRRAHFGWDTLSTHQKTICIKRSWDALQLELLSDIYLMLRSDPKALSVAQRAGTPARITPGIIRSTESTTATQHLPTEPQHITQYLNEIHDEFENTSIILDILRTDPTYSIPTNNARLNASSSCVSTPCSSKHLIQEKGRLLGEPRHDIAIRAKDASGFEICKTRSPCKEELQSFGFVSEAQHFPETKKNKGDAAKQSKKSKELAHIPVLQERWRGLDLLLQKADSQHIAITELLKEQRRL